MRRWRVSQFSINRCKTLGVLNIKLYESLSIFAGIHVCDLLLLITSFGPGFRLRAHNVKKWLTLAIPLPVYQQGSDIQ